MKTEPDSAHALFLKQTLLLAGSPSLAVTRIRVTAFCFTKTPVHGQ
jgi:hypothetical protein